MAFDFLRVFTEIINHKNEPTIDDFMKKIIDTCTDIRPGKNWEIFSELEFSIEIETLSKHVVNTLKKEPPPFTEQGFWFGISDDGSFSFAVSNQYTDEEDNLDWIFEADTHYPAERDFQSKIFQSIHHLSYDKTNLENDAEYPLCLAYGLKLAQASMQYYKGVYPNKKVGYSVGFDSGDFITLGWV